jgi:NAD(P)-dependent dehydrogenase (short-subunit alcohol dehydrogenase family)
MNRAVLTGQTAVVTGGARGIGYATAERALQSGAAVSLWDIDAARLAQAQSALSRFGQVEARIVEITDESSVEAATDETVRRLGKVDVLINNAGITGGNDLTWKLAPEVWRRVIEVNLIGPYLACRAVVPRMIENGYGRIVNVASIAGKDGNPNASHYSASKAGLIGLTKSLGKELATKNILVNCVTPAAVKTELFEQMQQEHIDYMLSKIPMGRFLQAEELAALICWLGSRECSFSTGAVFDISGGRATY